MARLRRRFFQRDGVLLVLLTVLSFGLMASGEPVRWGVGRVLEALLYTPLERVIGAGRGFWAGTTGKRLEEEAVRLREENTLLAEAAAENERLRAALGFRQRVRGPMIPAEVIGRRGTFVEPLILIDRGRDAAITVNMPVVGVNGLVGRIVETSGTTSWVMPLTNPACRVSGVVRRSGVVGIVAARPGGALALTGVPLLADVAPGDLVVTSGLGGVFPAGWPVGEAVAMAPEFGGLLSRVELRPATNLDLLEEVFVLRGQFSPPDPRVEELAPPDQLEGAPTPAVPPRMQELP